MTYRNKNVLEPWTKSKKQGETEKINEIKKTDIFLTKKTQSGSQIIEQMKKKTELTSKIGCIT